MAEEQKSVSLECSGKNLQISVVSIQNRFDTNSSSDITQKFRSIQNLQKPTLDHFSSFSDGRERFALKNQVRKSLRKLPYSRKHSNSL